MLDAFGIGTTSDCYISVGIWPDWIDRLNNLVTVGAILEAVFFNFEAETPSGPEALDMSKLESNCSTSPTVHSRLSGHSSGWTKFNSIGNNGGCVVLKQLEKNEFNKSALSLSQLAETLYDKVGTEQGFLFRCLMVFQNFL